MISGIEEVTERGPPTCGILMNGTSSGEEVKDYFAQKEGIDIGQHYTTQKNQLPMDEVFKCQKENRKLSRNYPRISFYILRWERIS